MDFKILGKAMGYMFMPTLGVLLMLLVGFFDPIAMWNFIKSDNGWAIVIRVVLFLAETGLIYVMYQHFLKKDIIENAETYISGKPDKACNAGDDFDDYCFKGSRYDDFIEIYNTEKEAIKVVKLVKKR